MESQTRQQVFAPDGTDLAGQAHLAACDVPSQVELPGFDPWGGASSYGTLEMSCHQLVLDKTLKLATADALPVFVLGEGPAWSVECPDRYSVRPYTGGALEATDVPGLLLLTGQGLRVSDDVYPVELTHTFSSA